MVLQVAVHVFAEHLRVGDGEAGVGVPFLRHIALAYESVEFVLAAKPYGNPRMLLNLVITSKKQAEKYYILIFEKSI